MLSRRGIAINKQDVENELVKMQNELTVQPIANEYQPDMKYKVYLESENYIVTPRNYPPAQRYVTSSKLEDGDAIDCEFNGRLNKDTYQHEASDNVLDGLHTKGSGILNLPTGYGKTTVALYILSQIKQKTLIVVHKEFLMNQWFEKINHFLPNMKVGKIQGNVIDVQDKDIVIGMLQSLSKKEYERENFDGFGLTIIDEVHHVCTKSFSRFLLKYNTKYLLGLSATIERKDGLTHVLHWFLGDVLYKQERVNKTDVTIVKVSIKDESYATEKFPVNRMGKPNFPEAINKITELQFRNDVILQIVTNCLCEQRRILILTDRRAHCEHLCHTMTDIKCGLYLGGMKQADLEKSEQCDVLVGTYALANEGLDIPILDTLILATPKSDVIQSVGRILRETKDKKNSPIVYDLVDTWGTFKYQFYKRNKFYTHSGFKMKYEEPSSR
tara:strand:+ start:1416 stop:2741 length:1326 start_codon:yes stop_codon:yes gene_type:complete